MEISSPVCDVRLLQTKVTMLRSSNFVITVALSVDVVNSLDRKVFCRRRSWPKETADKVL